MPCAKSFVICAKFTTSRGS